MSTSRDLERKSSAVTLSDMEMFIFPELIYSLVLANIMSPRLWLWRDDPWFDGLERMKPYRRITRLKQFIMDHYVFNLDLDTWGLTTKEQQMDRFGDFISANALAQSNALFGYEGDKYYFDIDIRTHFGLDKYEGNIIPYWKTETLEAMDAFCHKPGYKTGAGECVSLSTLYAAALFVVARIPLKDIFLMATPLHSQNFVDINEGILTNNRRLVTKNMWFNGTALSAQARRALENERVTIVAHESGCMHILYKEASLDPKAFDHFASRLEQYLHTSISPEILGSFVRHGHDIQKCFQMRCTQHGRDMYIPIERLLAYEQGSPYSITDNTRDKLMADVDMEELQPAPLKSRIILNDLEAFVRENPIDICDEKDMDLLKSQFASDCLSAEIALAALRQFCHTTPRLPDPADKTFSSIHAPLGLDTDMSREEVAGRLESIRDNNVMADLAFYALRDMNRTDPEPFLQAAIRRNPVCLNGARDLDDQGVEDRLRVMDEKSIYDGPDRLAQPDEVWNYGRGDGLEKAILLAAILRHRHPDEALSLAVKPGQAVLKTGRGDIAFESQKQIREQIWTLP